ncbi:BlaI/MecI/CopY family transcriptional regulator [candidate division GN15 bacterium]|nr:BlaI/MecI/CopY family transcriptional regulator [candidate division GN15 bacterium]
MKHKDLFEDRSRRERQIVEILVRRGEATVADVRSDLPDPPSYSAVRALLAVLVDKGAVKHRRHGRAYLYRPAISPERARESALKHVVQTFFDGSVSEVIASLVTLSDRRLSADEIARLQALIDEKKGKKNG